MGADGTRINISKEKEERRKGKEGRKIGALLQSGTEVEDGGDCELLRSVSGVGFAGVCNLQIKFRIFSVKFNRHYFY